MSARTQAITGARVRGSSNVSRAVSSEGEAMNPALPMRIGRRLQSASFEVKTFAADEYETVAAIWNELERLHGGDALTCSWNWIDAWLGSFGASIAHRFVVGCADGYPVGIAMLTRSNCRRRGPIPINSVHVGTA